MSGLTHGSVTLSTRRLDLVPLRVQDAEEMIEVLRDERLHEFIGGHPADLDELRTRYATLVAGSPDVLAGGGVDPPARCPDGSTAVTPR